MSLFFTVFFLLYGGLHLYAFLKVRAAFAPGVLISLCLGAFMIVMIMAPVTVRLSEKAGLEAFARVAAYAAYTWMGAVFIFFCAGIALDLFRLIIYVLGRLVGFNYSIVTSGHAFFLFAALFITVFVVAYGVYEAGNIRTEKVVLYTDKTPANPGRVRIAQISDVHIGLIVGGGKIEKILEEVKRWKPDILVSTGDLVDIQLNNLDALSNLLREIHAPYGKFAVTGNHEYYAGLERSVKFTREAGFRVLRGEAVRISGGISVAGIDDGRGSGYSRNEHISEKGILSNLKREDFVIFLKHRPVVNGDSLGLFDLQLSGHTHKGQIFPFGLIVKLFFPNHSGYFKLPHGSHLYVSRDSGTWGPPIRFLAPPQVTLIEVVHREN